MNKSIILTMNKLIILTILIVSTIIICIICNILIIKKKYDTIQNKTIVTGFFNLKRDEWPTFTRKLNHYLNNSKRNLSLNENMVIFIEDELLDFVKECRKNFLNKTHIIVIKKEELPKYKLRNKIKNIMESDTFKKDLVSPTVPEMWNPDYVITIWSKTDMVYRAIKENPFKSTHFCWLDFGIGDYCNIKMFPKKFKNKIKILCRSMPRESDLDRVKMSKSHTNRFAGGFFTGEKNYMLYFIKEVDNEINKFLELNVVDCEQTMFSNVYLQNKNIFELYYGDWKDIITGYNKYKFFF